jgi:hypothetical protein
VSRIESAQGMLSEQFAFCQTMPFDEFLTTADALRASCYRPVRLRPYSDGETVRVAAVWTRDGRPWRILSKLTPEEVRKEAEVSAGRVGQRQGASVSARARRSALGASLPANENPSSASCSNSTATILMQASTARRNGARVSGGSKTS